MILQRDNIPNLDQISSQMGELVGAETTEEFRKFIAYY